MGARYQADGHFRPHRDPRCGQGDGSERGARKDGCRARLGVTTRRMAITAGTNPPGAIGPIGQDPMNETGWCGRVSVAVEQVYAIDLEPVVKARMLRELASWYQALAMRVANP